MTLSTGKVLEADIVIGADGPRSLVRPVVLGRPDDAVPSGFTIFGTTIPAEKMMKDPELAKLVQANEVSLRPPEVFHADSGKSVADYDGHES